MHTRYVVLRGACVTTVCLAVVMSSLCSTAWAQAEDVAILAIPDTTVSPEDGQYALSFYLTNPLSLISAFELSIAANRPDLLELVYSPAVDTFVTCNGALCDTSISTINRVEMDVAGTPIQNWEYIQARAWTPSFLKVLAISDVVFKPGATPPMPTSDTPVFLFSVIIKRIAEPWYLDTASERSVTWFAQQIGTSIVDHAGQNVPFPDTIICWDPPACTNVDTIPIMPSGMITIGPGCTRWGDVNRDNTITAADIIGLVSYVFKGGPEPECSSDVGDANCDGAVTSADIIFLVAHVFKGQAPPCVP